MFMSKHYTGVPLNVTFENGEPWKKVFGPVFIHLNSVSNRTKAISLWDDAKQQVLLCHIYCHYSNGNEVARSHPPSPFG